MNNSDPAWAEQLAGYRRDYLLMTCAAISAVLFLLAATGLVGMTSSLGRAAHAVHELLGVMWWGVLLAIVVIGVLDRIPQAYVLSLLGPQEGATGPGRLPGVLGLVGHRCGPGMGNRTTTAG